MDRTFLRRLQLPFLFLDLFLLNIIFLFTRHYIPNEAPVGLLSGSNFYWLLTNFIWVLAGWLAQLYTYQNLLVFRRLLQATFRIYVAWAFLVLTICFLLRDNYPLTRPFIYSTILNFGVALLWVRALYWLLRAWVRYRGGFKQRVLILGYNKVAERLAAYLEKEESDIRIECFVDDLLIPATHAKHAILPGISETLNIARELRVTEIYSTIMPENNARLYPLMQQADQQLIRLRFVPDFSSFIKRPVHVEYFYELPVLSVRKEPLHDVINRLTKRVFDIAVSLGVTVFILSWLIPLLGILIKLESAGPIFFVQKRSGLNNLPFNCFKFRSMTVNQDSNTKQATRNDARVTKLGRFMRQTSLDEFPQFLNVLLGKMSIVGPRPHMLKHTDEYSVLENQYMIRQFLKPGITGWAQVNGFRGEITELRHIQKRVEYDLWYLENWRLSLDIKIMFLTVYNVFKGEENAF
jgi:putative colanic acid biosynthesis UDP-glucose lipid carrier transferase